jgi:hydroxysqualene dehydroxylase
MTRGSDVVVIGGGLAGLSAAVDLADAGLEVTLLEARPWLGGATCSFARRGLTIDNGQHAFLRCCSAYQDLLRRLGSLDSCVVQHRLELAVFGPRDQLIVRRSALPAPLHLAGALASYRLLSPAERARAAAAAVALRFSSLTSRAGDVSLDDWLVSHGQDEAARQLFWDLLSVTALGAVTEHADRALFAGAVRRALLAGRASADIGVPAVPLSTLHSAPAAALLKQLGVRVRLGTKAAGVRVAARGGYDVRLDRYAPAAGELKAAGGGQDGEGRYGDGRYGAGRYREARAGTVAVLDARAALNGGPEIIHAAGVVLAVPAWAAAPLAPAELTADAGRWQQLESSPVLSLHVIYGSQVTELPFAAAVGSPLRWVADKTGPAGLHTGQYLAASVPAAEKYLNWPVRRLGAELLPELERLFPAAADADVQDFFVTKERRAVIRQEPGSQRFRGTQPAGLPGLAVAGAWTDTGWPDTMEGAVRSGHLAASKVADELSISPAPAPAAPPRPPEASAGPPLRGVVVRPSARLARAGAHDFPGSV